MQPPGNIANELTPRSLALGIRDDGQQVKRGGETLCTDSFDLEEVKILQEALKTNFNLETNIHKKKVKPEIYIIEFIYPKLG